jgi:hypothetical protein
MARRPPVNRNLTEEFENAAGEEAGVDEGVGLALGVAGADVDTGQAGDDVDQMTDNAAALLAHLFGAAIMAHPGQRRNVEIDGLRENDTLAAPIDMGTLRQLTGRDEITLNDFLRLETQLQAQIQPQVITLPPVDLNDPEVKQMLAIAQEYNVYDGLTPPDVHSVYIHRDISIEELNVEKLRAIDQIEPAWLFQIYTIPVQQLPTTSKINLLIWAEIFKFFIPNTLKERRDIGKYLVYCYYLARGPLPKAMSLKLNTLSPLLLQALLDQAFFPKFPAAGVLSRKEQIKAIVLRQLPSDFSERHARLSRIDFDKQQELLVKFHDGMPIYKILVQAPSIAERLLVGDLAPSPVYHMYGLVPFNCGHASLSISTCSTPLMDDDTRKTYLFDNLVACRYIQPERIVVAPQDPIFKVSEWRLGYLQELTDIAIIRQTGVFPYYTSREELINTVSRLYAEPNFFMPVDARRHYATNQTTLSSLSEVTANLPFVAYGTWLSYQVYEINDLIWAFSANEDGIYSFRKPHDPTTYFSRAQVKQLRSLISSKPWWLGSVQELIQSIDQALKLGIELERSDRSLLLQFRQLESDDKLLIKTALIKLFQAGMYMRQWKGPGYPYPVSVIMTVGTQQVDISVGKAISQMYASLNKLPSFYRTLFSGMPAIDARDGVIKRLNTSISTHVKGVMTEKLCIRENSTIFIGSATHYLKLFFQHDTEVDEMMASIR